MDSVEKLCNEVHGDENTSWRLNSIYGHIKKKSEHTLVKFYCERCFLKFLVICVRHVAPSRSQK